MAAILALATIGLVGAALVAAWEHGPGSRPGALRLFLGGLGVGVTTGAATGALIGALLVPAATGLDPEALAALPLTALFGSVVGFFVALAPSLLGALVVVGILSWRHPHPAVEEAVTRDLGRIFLAVVVALDAVLAAYTFAGTDSIPLAVLPLVVAGHACVVAILCSARRPMARWWVTAGP